MEKIPRPSHTPHSSLVHCHFFPPHTQPTMLMAPLSLLTTGWVLLKDWALSAAMY